LNCFAKSLMVTFSTKCSRLISGMTSIFITPGFSGKKPVIELPRVETFQRSFPQDPGKFCTLINIKRLYNTHNHNISNCFQRKNYRTSFLLAHQSYDIVTNKTFHFINQCFALSRILSRNARRHSRHEDKKFQIFR